MPCVFLSCLSVCTVYFDWLQFIASGGARRACCTQTESKTPSNQLLLTTPMPWDPVSSLQNKDRLDCCCLCSCVLSEFMCYAFITLCVWKLHVCLLCCSTVVCSLLSEGRAGCAARSRGRRTRPSRSPPRAIYIYIYIYIYTHIYIYIYIYYIHTYIYIYIHAYIHTYIHTCIHTYTQIIHKNINNNSRAGLYSGGN